MRALEAPNTTITINESYEFGYFRERKFFRMFCLPIITYEWIGRRFPKTSLIRVNCAKIALIIVIKLYDCIRCWRSFALLWRTVTRRNGTNYNERRFSETSFIFYSRCTRRRHYRRYCRYVFEIASWSRLIVLQRRRCNRSFRQRFSCSTRNWIGQKVFADNCFIRFFGKPRPFRPRNVIIWNIALNESVPRIVTMFAA